jgi:signal transduction histidine kinase/tetratricopeptide (TPR) repeat protein
MLVMGNYLLHYRSHFLKKSLLVFYIICCYGLLSGQEIAYHYHEVGIKPNALNIQGQIDSLIEEANSSKSPETAIPLLTKANELATTLNNSLRIARSSHLLGSIYRNQNRFKQAKSAFLQLIQFPQALRDSADAYLPYFNLGLCYKSLGDRDSAFYYFTHELTIQKGRHDSLGVLNCYIHLGELLDFQGKHQEALEYAYKAYGIAQQPAYSEHLGEVLNGLGTILARIEDFPQAIKYFNQAEKVHAENGNVRGQLGSLLNGASAKRSSGQYDSAHVALQKALKIANESAPNPRLIMGIYINLGDITLDQEKYSESGNWYQQGLKIATEFDMLHAQAYIQYRFAQLRYAQGQFSKSHAKGLLSLSLYGQLNDIPNQIKAHSLLAKTSRELGRFQESLKHLELYTAYQDSVDGVKLAETIKSMENTFKDSLAAQEKKVLSQQNEILVQKNELVTLRSRRQWLAIITLGLLALSIGLVLRQFYYQNRRISNINQQLTESRKAQIPLEKDKNNLIGLLTHDLRAPLSHIRNNLYHLSLQELPPSVKQLLDEGQESAEHIHLLSQELSNTSQIVSEEDRYLLSAEEPVQLQAIIKEVLHKYRVLAEAKNISFDLQENEDELMVLGSPLFLDHIVGNLVQNAIKYSPTGGTISIGCAKDHDLGKCSIFVQDQGPGVSEEHAPYIFSPEKPPGHNGNGSQGLYLWQQLAQAMQSEIRYEEAPEGGARFVLEAKLA